MRDFVSAGLPAQAFADGDAAARSIERPRPGPSGYFKYGPTPGLCQDLTKIVKEIQIGLQTEGLKG